jgi:hypothetical protein
MTRLMTAVSRAPAPTVVDTRPWVGCALQDEGETFRRLENKLVVRRSRLWPGFAIHFDANQPNRHWFALFDPRPYGFTMFEMDPEIPERYCIFPGYLPDRCEVELLLIGVPIDRTVSGGIFAGRLEVIAIGLVDANEHVRFWRPDKAVAGVYADELAKLVLNK